MLSSLIGLSLLTWHCPSRHWTSSHGSHLPNHHIHPLQKCQADKVSNFMPALTFKFFFISTCQTCWACFVLWYRFCLPSYLSSSKPWTTYRENSSKAFATGGCFWEERENVGHSIFQIKPHSWTKLIRIFWTKVIICFYFANNYLGIKSICNLKMSSHKELFKDYLKFPHFKAILAWRTDYSWLCLILSGLRQLLGKLASAEVLLVL